MSAFDLNSILLEGTVVEHPTAHMENGVIVSADIHIVSSKKLKSISILIRAKNRLADMVTHLDLQTKIRVVGQIAYDIYSSDERILIEAEHIEIRKKGAKNEDNY